MSADDYSCKVVNEEVQRGCMGWLSRTKRTIVETDLLLEHHHLT